MASLSAFTIEYMKEVAVDEAEVFHTYCKEKLSVISFCEKHHLKHFASVTRFKKKN